MSRTTIIWYKRRNVAHVTALSAGRVVITTPTQRVVRRCGSQLTGPLAASRRARGPLAVVAPVRALVFPLRSFALPLLGIPLRTTHSAMADAGAAANGGADKETTWATLKEGQAEVLHKPGEAFYNKAQVQNRDLSIAVIREFITLRESDAKAKAESGKGGAAAAAAAAAAPQGIRVLEGLSATGLRAVRYAKEIPGIREVVANDFSKGAVESIERNIAHNKVEDKVTASHGDAALVMYQNREPASARFDVIDLDPYGTAAPFLDAAVQAVQDGGLLAVTCTDLAVLCGNHSEACHAKYGSTSLRGKHCHEFALRIVLSSQKSSDRHFAT